MPLKLGREHLAAIARANVLWMEAIGHMDDHQFDIACAKAADALGLLKEYLPRGMHLPGVHEHTKFGFLIAGAAPPEGLQAIKNYFPHDLPEEGLEKGGAEIP